MQVSTLYVLKETSYRDTCELFQHSSTVRFAVHKSSQHSSHIFMRRGCQLVLTCLFENYDFSTINFWLIVEFVFVSFLLFSLFFPYCYDPDKMLSLRGCVGDIAPGVAVSSTCPDTPDSDVPDHLTRSSKSIVIFSDHLRLDCPSASCDGWLRVFGDADMIWLPTMYVRCSSEIDGEPSPNSNVRVMLSKFETICTTCSKRIREQALIASLGGSNKWVHCKCDKAGDASFAVCQRCHLSIKRKEDSSESTCGGVTGFCH
jgi:hypothetical protein